MKGTEFVKRFVAVSEILQLSMVMIIADVHFRVLNNLIFVSQQ